MDHASAQRFTEVCERVGLAPERAHSNWDDLRQRYSEEHRSYHNLSHIDRMLSWLDASSAGTDAIELAIWFHDVIYEPLGSHNEAKSAQHFVDHLGSFIGGSLVEDVERLIRATDPTRSRSGMPDEDMIIDIDLSILGSPPDQYEVYRSAVRREYSSVAEADFIAGRKSILQSFLSQRIYSTEFFAQLEQQARSNIKNEFECLEPAKS
jgi:predicted metal-dependent HD superfamily phosphohydrolase